MSLMRPAGGLRGWASGRLRFAWQGLAWLGLILLAVILAESSLELAVVMLAGVALSLAVLIVPGVALVAVALLIPFAEWVPLSVAGADVVDFLVVAAIGAWGLDGLRRRRVVLALPPLASPLLVFVWIAAASLTQALSWRDGLLEWLKWAEFAAVYLISTQVMSRRLAWATIVALLGVGLVQAALGAYQFIAQVGPEPFILFGRFMRAHGTFRQPNPYAGYLGYLAPVAASLALGGLEGWWRERGRSDLRIGVVCGAAAIALATGIGLSWSRGGWFGLAAGLSVVAGLRSRKTMVWAGLGIVVLVVVVLLFGTGWLPDVIANRVHDLGQYASGLDPARTEITDANFSVLERLAHWRAGLQMYGDHPWLGVGIGNYGVAYTAYAAPHWYEALGHAHNVYINFLAETGILGAVAFGVFWLSAMWLAWRIARRMEASVAALAIGVFGSLVYLTVHNLFDNLFVQHMQLQLALLLGALTVMETNTS